MARVTVARSRGEYPASAGHLFLKCFALRVPTHSRVVSQFDGGGAFVWSSRQHWGHLHTFVMSVPMPSPKPDR